MSSLTDRTRIRQRLANITLDIEALFEKQEMWEAEADSGASDMDQDDVNTIDHYNRKVTRCLHELEVEVAYAKESIKDHAASW